MRTGYNLLRKSSRSSSVEEANLIAVNTLIQAGCERIYLDFAPGEKSQLWKALSLLKPGNTLLVPRFQILAKSQSSFLKIIDALKQKSAHLESLEESYLLSSNSQLIECLNLATALFPSEEKYCRCIRPLKKPKINGRPHISNEQKELIHLLHLLKINDKKINVTKICQLSGICRATYYNLFPDSNKTQKIAS